MTNSDLSGANLTNANLSGANLYGAVLTATNLTNVSFGLATYTDGRLCAEGSIGACY